MRTANQQEHIEERQNVAEGKREAFGEHEPGEARIEAYHGRRKVLAAELQATLVGEKE